jgi:hypothetical protein
MDDKPSYWQLKAQQIKHKKDPTVPAPEISPNQLLPKKKGKDIFDWDIDEIIEYKQHGITPPRMLSSEAIFRLAKAGLSMNSIAGLFSSSPQLFTNNPELREAFDKGRAEISFKVRQALINDALEGESVAAKIYLDKILSGETQKQEISISMNRPLSELSDVELLEIDFDGKDSSN